jgi:phage/plasmid primase-like uncharacterized protein
MATQQVENLTEQFRRFIIDACDTDPGHIIADGRWHRFRIADTRHKGSKPGRYLLHLDGRPNGIFMDWRSGSIRHKWRADGNYESIDRDEVARRRSARQVDQMRAWADAAADAVEFWKSCGPLNDGLHPYLEAKGIAAQYGTRQGSGERFGLGDVPCVIIPLSDADGKPMSLQAIREDGERRFWPGTTHEGAHFMVGADTGGQVVFCEGFSTAASIHGATGLPVVMCVTSANMAAVARWAGHKWVGRDMIVAGDDDWHLLDHPKVKRNVGKDAALQMAKMLPGRAIFPDMAGLVTDGGDDFNDMAREYGDAEVAATILSAEMAEVGGDADLDASADVLGFRLTDWSTDRFFGDAPPIRWLCEGSIPLGVPALFAAMGGVGKSFMALDMALEIAAEVIGGGSDRRILGGAVVERGSVVVLSAEDGKDSVHRRMQRIDTGDRRERANGKLFVVPLPEVGGPMPLISGGGGEFVKTNKFEALMAQLQSIPDLKLIVVDPLQAFVTADITKDPAAGQFMWSSFAQLCAKTGATVIACHHMRKEGSFAITSADGAREAIRGSTALIDGARATYALWGATDDDTKRVCIEANVEYRPKRVVHGAVVKSNDEHDWDIHTYLRGDNGLLVDAHDAGNRAAQKTAKMTEAQCLAAIKALDNRWRKGRPFSAAANSRDRYFVPWMQREFGVSKEVAKAQLDNWFHAEMVISEMFDAKAKMVGLRVVKWPD